MSCLCLSTWPYLDTAQRSVLPVYLPVDLLICMAVINPSERKLAKRTSVHSINFQKNLLPARLITLQIFSQFSNMFSKSKNDQYIFWSFSFMSRLAWLMSPAEQPTFSSSATSEITNCFKVAFYRNVWPIYQKSQW